MGVVTKSVDELANVFVNERVVGDVVGEHFELALRG